MSHRIDVLCVGDIVTEPFIKLLPHEAEIDKDPIDKHPLLCMTYGSKIPFESMTVIEGVGNSANAAVSLARLGLKSSLMATSGDDDIGRGSCLSTDRSTIEDVGATGIGGISITSRR